MTDSGDSQKPKRRNSNARHKTGELRMRSKAPAAFLEMLESEHVPLKAQRMILHALDELASPTIDTSPDDARKLVKRFVKHVESATSEAINPNYSRPPTTGAIARALEKLLWNFRRTELDRLDARLEADLEQLAAALNGIAG